MQKNFWFLLASSCFLQGCGYRSLVGHPLVLTKGMCPVFTTSEMNLSYESGEHGTNCYTLDTVLMPPARLSILEASNPPIYKIFYQISEKIQGTGYVHQHFLDTCCEQSEKNSEPPIAMPLKDIRNVFERCITEEVPYCFGGNCFTSIPLPKEYQFSPFGTFIPGKPFELRGFDCSGLLVYISNGILPHCTRGLHECGEKIYTFYYQKDDSDAEKQKVLASLCDTDYLVFVHNKERTKSSGSGHVIVSYKGGFIEFQSKAKGCCFTPKGNALQRLQEMIASSKKSGSDLWVIRWHPEASTSSASHE